MSRGAAAGRFGISKSSANKCEAYGLETAARMGATSGRKWCSQGKVGRYVAGTKGFAWTKIGATESSRRQNMRVIVDLLSHKLRLPKLYGIIACSEGDFIMSIAPGKLRCLLSSGVCNVGAAWRVDRRGERFDAPGRRVEPGHALVPGVAEGRRRRSSSCARPFKTRARSIGKQVRFPHSLRSGGPASEDLLETRQGPARPRQELHQRVAGPPGHAVHAAPRGPAPDRTIQDRHRSRARAGRPAPAQHDVRTWRAGGDRAHERQHDLSAGIPQSVFPGAGVRAGGAKLRGPGQLSHSRKAAGGGAAGGQRANPIGIALRLQGQGGDSLRERCGPGCLAASRRSASPPGRRTASGFLGPFGVLEGGRTSCWTFSPK